ncbi:phage tail tape measure protein [Sesbania bispinosa]|nr:phage tail tape measure protein [Sesbania bispinosa]
MEKKKIAGKENSKKERVVKAVLRNIEDEKAISEIRRFDALQRDAELRQSEEVQMTVPIRQSKELQRVAERSSMNSGKTISVSDKQYLQTIPWD